MAERGSALIKAAGAIRGFIKWFCFAFTVAFLVIMYSPAANMLAAPLIMPQSLIKTDLIIVLGGGAYANGTLGGASNERLIHGLLLYKDGWAPRIMFSGGTIIDPARKILRSVSGEEGITAVSVVEASIMKDISARLGIPQRLVAADARSASTYENLRNAKAYMDEKKLKTCLVVTGPTHMLRASLTAKKLGMGFYPAPVANYTGHRTSAFERVGLLGEVMWEYAGLVLYKIKGYI
ncbi:MAG: YdcF family protein [Deltaproteobacteria bacterium]|nr:YdcF family protein [Deltaproteobacteria bacterium]